MVSTIAGNSSKQRRRNVVLIAGTLLAVLVLIYFLSPRDSQVLQQSPETAVHQTVPITGSDEAVLIAEMPDQWLQASGSSSGNPAWAPAVVSPFDTLWSISTGRELFSPPALQGNMIFIAGNDKTLRGINRTTGQQIWSRTVTCGLSGGVAADSSAVYFSGQDGYMYALNLETGSEKWRTGLGYHIFTDACVFCDSLILSGNSMGSIAALSRETGDLIWSDTMDGLLLGPAFSDSTAVFSTEAGAVGAWNLSGSTLWSRGFSSQPSAPSIESGVVYLGFSSGKVLALSLQTGETIWETALDGVQGRTVVSRPAVYRDSVLVAGTCDGRVFCLEASGGTLVWETQLENWISLTPAVCDTIVYASCDDGKLHLLSLNTGLPVDEIETGSYSGTPPILSGGVLYTGNSAGVFTAVSGTVPGAESTTEEE
ncbi:MAG: PQQ-binding-like beta-propeller repeat protein [Candidatus Fermentibacteraceae bacterium]|nr:PQQ-binding-like beta-propeller repeat protein [Candidatus Fermentibacteraceae bacterium]